MPCMVLHQSTSDVIPYRALLLGAPLYPCEDAAQLVGARVRECIYDPASTPSIDRFRVADLSEEKKI